MRTIIGLILLLITSIASAEVYNPYTRKYETGSEVRYLASEKQYKAAPRGARETLNPYTGKRTWAKPGAQARYNPYTKQREMATSSAQLKRNSQTGVWAYDDD